MTPEVKERLYEMARENVEELYEQNIRSQQIDSRARKNMLYEARYYGQTSSARLYMGSGKKPGFTKKPTVDEQLNKKPATETSESSCEQR